MRVPPPFLLAAALACVSPACAVAATSCAGNALAHLRASSREGYATYARSDPAGSFLAWIDCDDAQFGLPTAVHEATHLETAATDTFALVGGGRVARPHEVSRFLAPARIADRFAADDFTTIYLRPGKASAATDALYLLDEFNAYTHDLAAAVDLRALSRPDEGVDHRDGLAAMMGFVSAYAEAARTEDGETWRGLQTPRVAGVVRALWSRAERVMESSCGIPRFGTRDKGYLERVCAAGSQSALATILGRSPACATACLAETPDDPEESPDESSTVEPADFTEVPHHPFAAAAAPRRHRPAPGAAPERVSGERDQIPQPQS